MTEGRSQAGQGTIKTDASSSSLGNFPAALPIAASALAMCWEVGSFVPLGVDQFSLFSFGEHIVFACAALPFALLASAILLSYWLGISVPRWISRAWLGLRWRLGSWFFYIKFGGLLFFGVALVIVALARRGPTLFFFGVGAIGIAFAFLFPRPTRLMFFALWSLGFAFSLGIDSTRNELKLKSEQPSSVVNFKPDSKIPAAPAWSLIRSGERGALTYEPKSRKLFFAKWDQIESIESPRLDIFEYVLRYLPRRLGFWFQEYFLRKAPRFICGVYAGDPERPSFSFRFRQLCE